jgi:hypothetical protein
MKKLALFGIIASLAVFIISIIVNPYEDYKI